MATLYVGNIPYDATQQEIYDLFKQCGTVTDIKMTQDPQNQKGYCFVSFKDELTAESARQHMSNYEFRGRKLLINYSQRTAASRAISSAIPSSGLSTSSMMLQSDQMSHAHGMGFVPASHPQIDIEVQEGLETFTLEQLHSIITDFKGLILQDPEQARQLLIEYPQLAQAILQSLLMIGMHPSLPALILASVTGLSQSLQMQAPSVSASQTPSALTTAALSAGPSSSSLGQSAQPGRNSGSAPAASRDLVISQVLQTIRNIKKIASERKNLQEALASVTDAQFQPFLNIRSEHLPYMSKEDQQIMKALLLSRVKK
ncbi:putative cleavage stimulation factor subunit 2 [Monocercomonoides exilis]|uniref:putative cleavage stimulation factor subunit 2 n=1 Tax=Monocercomonoides exilis TaxID=2049356 RepID=UPI00355A8654|nr:putative cleavage stimulation factor subunit 2 [Monocercomonoides exilis]|eukprot:MONOS_6124.1-p1 / transcript=MONOS_6124.1 / gene=MONOS_6124 / organism=Monocercomonoides_exilis_PA203 / gene_product=unspecified product / transcript_product=unspecified product / location=Mono_scaffold00188:92109-93283(+) / protein_length=314 / sequence_SO=supercontig / SO=protein_coding / is_pseudo=false